MRWIATLVATCLVALGALRAPRPQASDRARHEAALDDASGLVAKLTPRRPTAVAPEKRTEQLDVLVPPGPPWVDRPGQLACVATVRSPRAPWVRHLLARTSRGPPRDSSPGIISLS
ncbi:MAG: hypothetical protein SFX73_20945 [Kofleriaceae bacterium]|nr:hypothetical protein [Kofleriaceae bacterium]